MQVYPRWLMGNGWGGQVTDAQRTAAGYFLSAGAGAPGVVLGPDPLSKAMGFLIGAGGGNLLSNVAQNVMGARSNDIQLETSRNGKTWHLVVSYDAFGQYTVRRSPYWLSSW
jgi:hypothetical protein